MTPSALCNGFDECHDLSDEKSCGKIRGREGGWGYVVLPSHIDDVPYKCVL